MLSSCMFPVFIYLLSFLTFEYASQDGKMSSSVADAVDYKGFPADRSKTGGWVPAALILGLSSDSLATAYP